MKILFVASEVAPYAKTGGLADVAGALPRALRALGHDVRVVMPFYPRVRAKAPDPEVVFPEHIVPIGKHGYAFALLKAAKEDTYFIHSQPAFGREAIYAADGDEHLRFMLLSRAALESAIRTGFIPDLIHVNDWQTGFVPLLVKTMFPQLASARTLLTIHNLAYQGIFGAHVLGEIGLASHAPLLHQEQLHAGMIGYLLHGILYADGISTVSPTYAREIQTPLHGAGLQDLLAARSSRLVGILNGVDYDEWSPAVDKHIAAHYDADSLPKKELNKQALLQRVGLPYSPAAPVFGIVSRMASQKGFQLCPNVLAKLLGNVDCRLVVLGSGEKRLELIFQELARRFPGKARLATGYNEDLAHLIEAGSDFFLMPSRYEPCGLNQMYSLRYGTPPIVHRTGGLADTVELWNPRTGQGTGFPFEHFDEAGLEWAILEALSVFQDRRALTRLRQNGMAMDFSWAHQAKLYAELYGRLQKL